MTSSKGETRERQPFEHAPFESREEAHRALLQVARDRPSLDPSKPFDRWHAKVLDGKEAAALRALQLAEAPVIGYGGEMVPQGEDEGRYPGSACAVQYPIITSGQASLDRLSLASDADCFDAAIDAAHAIGARDSTERMLAHQMAAAHTLAMKMIARATTQIGRAELHSGLDAHVRLAECSTKLALVGARLMEAYQRGMKTLYRVRTGNQQTVTVVHQHVNVGEGGQAAVAGSVNTGAGGRSGGAAPN